MNLRVGSSDLLEESVRDIRACDFTVAYDWLFRPWCIFVVMELKTHRIVHAGVTHFQTEKWTGQQLRKATPWGKDRSI